MKLPNIYYAYLINSFTISIIKASSLLSISKGGQQLLLII